MDKETKEQIHVLQLAILEQGKTISNIMKLQDKQQESVDNYYDRKYDGLLVSNNFWHRVMGFIGYSLFGWILYFAGTFLIGFIIGIISLLGV